MNWRYLPSASALAFVLPSIAMAQSATRSAPPAASPGKTFELQTIVVTAEKRSENINAVGMSITAATGVQLQQKGITTVADLTTIEPSLQFSKSDYGTQIYTIRGVGYYEEALAATPAVSIYQDEVPYPFPVMSKGVLLDPERVEILKGPQGTLYGQNSTGGAINFIAAKPTNTFTAGIDDSFGRFNDNLLSGFVSGPLTPTVNARLSASTENGGAWQKSETRDDTLGDKDTQIARLILAWRPNSNFTATLNLNGWIDHSDTQAGQLEGVRFISPQFISPAALTPPAANFLPNAAYFATYPAAIKALVSEPTSPTNDQQADWAPGSHPHNNESYYQGSLRMDYSISDSLGLTSLTSYERYNERDTVEPGGNGAPYLLNITGGSIASFSQELRLHGTFNENKGHWLVGANYERDRNDESDYFATFLGSSSYLTGGSPFSPAPGTPFNFGNSNFVTATTVSVFFNADYRVLDTVTLHAGVRYTQSDQRTAGCMFGSAPATAFLNSVASALAAAFGGPSPTSVLPGQCFTLGPAPDFQPGLQHFTLNQSNVPWRVGIDWSPVEDTLLYFNVSQGYKAGASPSLAATDYIQLKPVTQESLLSYEVGIKSSLFDHRLQLNGALFHYDYTDKQFLGSVVDPLGIFGALQALVNIPKSAEDGAELSAVWRPVGGLTLDAAVTYLDSRVTSDYFGYSIYAISDSDTFNFKGEPFPNTPKWSVRYGARYDWHLANGYSAFVSADASYQSKSAALFGVEHAIQEGAPSLEIKPYCLLNLTAGVETPDKHWRFELWGKNVTNTYYWNSVIESDDAISRLAGMPATFGIGVHYRY